MFLFSFPDLSSKNVRRVFYAQNSPAGKGTKWEWAGPGTDWHSYNMDVQCIIEEAWAKVNILET